MQTIHDTDHLVTRHHHPFAAAALTVLMFGACSNPSSQLGQTVAALDQTVLGTAQSFAVLGGSTVTNTGSTTVHGNLGVHPGLSVTGFPPGLVTGGTIHSGDAVTLQAQTDTTAAYLALAGEVPTQDLTGQDLGGLTLTPGVYHFAAEAQLTGTLTLDALGDPTAVFVFQIGSTLTTASNASVLVLGGNDCNVFWQVGSSATLGTTTSFKGNIVALTSITLTTGASVSGRTLARNAAVTLDTNRVSTLACTGANPGADAGVPDAALPIDGGSVPDAGTPDAGAPDAGAPTDGPADAGVEADCAVDAAPVPVDAVECEVDAAITPDAC